MIALYYRTIGIHNEMHAVRADPQIPWNGRTDASFIPLKFIMCQETIQYVEGTQNCDYFLAVFFSADTKTNKGIFVISIKNPNQYTDN